MSELHQILDRMTRQIQDWETTANRRAIFLSCYKQMTQNMLAGIDAADFHDPPWVNQLLHRFAEYYFNALVHYEAHDGATPLVWQQVHDSANRVETLVIQNLILGVNAHINYDLVLTLVDLLQAEWENLQPALRQQRYADYCLVNDVIGRTIDTVQDTVIERWSPLMDVVDKLLGRLDEWLISHLITHWREKVWQQAVQVIETADPTTREQLRQQIEASTLKRADAILLKDGLTTLQYLL